MTDIAGGLVGGGLGWSLAQRIRARRMRRLMALRRIEVAMRVTSGVVTGLTTRWRHGVAQIEPATIEFLSYLPSGIRIRRPFAKAAIVNVASAVPNSRVLDPSEHWWGPGPGCVLVEIRAAGASLEVGIEAAYVEWFINEVTPSGAADA